MGMLQHPEHPPGYATVMIIYYLLNTAEYGVTLGSTAVNFPPPASSLSAVSRIEIESAVLTRQNTQSMSDK